MTTTVYQLIDQAKELSKAEQVDLIYYLSQHLNQPKKLVHVEFGTMAEDTPPLTDDEFEQFLEWLQDNRHGKQKPLNLSQTKIMRLLTDMSQSIQPDLPGLGLAANWSNDEELMAFERSMKETA